MSDRVTPGTFYLLHGGTVYQSADGGKSWLARNADKPLPTNGVSGFRTLRSVPGHAGHLWASLDTNGAWHSTDGGQTWERLKGVEISYLFALGKEKAGATNPALYVLGEIAGNRGLFRSDDNGVRWSNIGTDQLRFGAANSLEGDRQV